MTIEIAAALAAAFLFGAVTGGFAVAVFYRTEEKPEIKIKYYCASDGAWGFAVGGRRPPGEDSFCFDFQAGPFFKTRAEAEACAEWYMPGHSVYRDSDAEEGP